MFAKFPRKLFSADTSVSPKHPTLWQDASAKIVINQLLRIKLERILQKNSDIGIFNVFFSLETPMGYNNGNTNYDYPEITWRNRNSVYLTYIRKCLITCNCTEIMNEKRIRQVHHYLMMSRRILV